MLAGCVRTVALRAGSSNLCPCRRERTELESRAIEAERELQLERELARTREDTVAHDAPARPEPGPSQTPHSARTSIPSVSVPAAVDSLVAAETDSEHSHKPTREECAGGTWAKTLDAASGKAYYCPVVLTACGDPVWEMPQEGIILSSAFAQQIRSDDENRKQAGRAHAVFGQVLLTIILVQSALALALAAYMEYDHKFISNLALLPFHLFVSTDSRALPTAKGPGVDEL